MSSTLSTKARRLLAVVKKADRALLSYELSEYPDWHDELETIHRAYEELADFVEYVAQASGKEAA